MPVQNSIYQVLSTFGKNLVNAVDAAAARTQLGFTSTGSAVATATDQTAARTAIGLGTMATQPATSVEITGGSATLTSLSSTTGTFTGSTASVNPQTGAVVITGTGGLGVGGAVNAGALSSFPSIKAGPATNLCLINNSSSTQVNPITLPVERLGRARYLYTTSFGGSTPPISGVHIFDPNPDNFGDYFNSSWVEIDFGFGSGATGFRFMRGALYFVSRINAPDSITIDYTRWSEASGADVVNTVTYPVSATSFGAGLCWSIPLDSEFEARSWIKKVKMTFNRAAGGTMRLDQILWFVTRPESTETPIAIISNPNSPLQEIFGSLTVTSDNRASKTTIGLGTLSANALPVYASDAAAAADSGLTQGSFYVITGETIVRRKP